MNGRRDGSTTSTTNHENSARAPRKDTRVDARKKEERTNDALQIGFVLLVSGVLLVLFLIARSFKKFQRDYYSRSVDLSESTIRPGLNIDNLPAVKIDYGKYKPSENTGDDSDNEDDAGGGNGGGKTPSDSAAARRVNCLTRGVFLGKKNEYVDCSSYCRVSSEKIVKYVFLTSSDTIINGRTKMSPGAWCMPTTAANCNTSSAMVVYSLNGWLCIPRTDALVGEGGNQIAVCNGSIFDNGLNVRYDQFVPSNLTFNDFFHDRLANGKYRFQCVENSIDELKNKYLVAPFNRFHLLHNWCVEDIPFAKDTSVPNFQTGQCFCDDPYGTTTEGKCTACRVGFDKTSFTFNLRVQQCFSVRDYVSFLDRIKGQLLPNEIVRPCGIDESDSSGSEVTRPRCLLNKIGVFSPPLPSPNTLSVIKSKMTD